MNCGKNDYYRLPHGDPVNFTWNCPSINVNPGTSCNSYLTPICSLITNFTGPYAPKILFVWWLTKKEVWPAGYNFDHLVGFTWKELVTTGNSWSHLAFTGHIWSHILCPICKLIWLTSNFSLHVRHCQAVEQHPRRWRKKMCIAQMMTSSFPINSSWTMIFLLWYFYFSLPASITSGCIHRFPRARLKLSRFQLLQTSRCWRI